MDPVALRLLDEIVTDLDRRLDTIERQIGALANSINRLVARVDKLEDLNEFVEIGIAGEDDGG